MYKHFYNLERNPFDISPDPYFYFPTADHNEALANLYYGVQRRKGFIVVTGEVGTGKTLLLHCLLDLLSKTDISSAYVFNTRLAVLDFLQYVAADLRLPYSGRSKAELLVGLNNHLVSSRNRNSTVVLLVDEAQLLSWELLEELRLLGNLETAQQKLLQIVLAGQPELERKLDLPRLIQLKQRVSLRCRLRPMTEIQTRSYIVRRLELAGRNGSTPLLFTESAIQRIHRQSHGIPRLINSICENALITGFAHKTNPITDEIVAEVSADFRLDEAPSTQTTQTCMAAGKAM